MKCPTCKKERCNHFNNRIDGRIEWICPHGIGHTTYDSAVKCAEKYGEIKPDGSNKLEVVNAWLIHGCDGCCKEMYKKEMNKKILK